MKNNNNSCGKRKTVNRMLAHLLAFFLVLNSFGGTVFAYEEENQQDINTEYEEEKELDVIAEDAEDPVEEQDPEKLQTEEIKEELPEQVVEEETELPEQAVEEETESPEQAVEEEIESPEFEYQESVEGYTISISAPEGVFPKETETRIIVVNDPISLIEGELDEDREIQYVITFDISFWHDGAEIEPQNEKVSVTISLTEDLKETLQDDTAELQVFHIENDEEIEEVAAITDDEEIIFEADSFSPYSVVVSTTSNTTPIKYTIWFNKNSSNASGYMNYLNCEYGTEYQLPKCTMTSKGYKFTGWNTKEDGTGTAYADEAKVKNLSSTNYDRVNLYAQWVVDYSSCTHSGFIDGAWVSTYNEVVKQATSTEWGRVDKKCTFCHATVETVNVHPYDTYQVVMEDGSTTEVCGWADSDSARQVYEQLNQYRSQNGLNTLVYNSSLEYASIIRAVECYVYFQHTRPNGTKWNTITSGWSSGGENLALGYQTSDAAMQGWKDSPGHNANMLRGINNNESPWQGVSVGCFHVMNFRDDLPVETITWTQHFTFYDRGAEDDNEIRVITDPQSITANNGQAVTLSLSAKGSDLSYTWEYKAEGSNKWNTVGASNPCTLIAGVDINTGVYRCNIKNGRISIYSGIATITVSGGSSAADSGTYRHCVWEHINGKSYWYEDNTRQGNALDLKCFSYEGTKRGREIFDSASDGWYWLDVNADGAKAVGKEVFMPYIYQDQAGWSDEDIRNMAAASGADADGNYEHAELAAQVERAIREGTGKWVRYDNNGKMLKGWVTIEGDLAVLYADQVGNTYYYDRKTGLMAKGETVIGGQTYYFDEVTGALR